MKGCKLSFWQLVILIFLQCTLSYSQCIQNYAWTNWNSFSDNQATGIISVDSKEVKVTMTSNFPISSSNRIDRLFLFKDFSGYSSIPTTPVPKTTWSAGAGGKTVMCFSEPVTNPVLLIASLGSPSLKVNLSFSEPFVVLFSGSGITVNSSYSLSGAEGNVIILFPGIFTCLTINSETPEYYTNITWGMQIPISPITIIEDYKECGVVKLTANGAKSYLWNDGQNPMNATNYVTTSGVYSVTATDGNGCKTIALKSIPTSPKLVVTTNISKTICQGESISDYTSTGVYTDSLKTQYGCDSIRTLNLTVLEKPGILLSSQKEICQGQSVSLIPSISSITSPVTYKWSTGETASSITTTGAGVYSLTVANGSCSNVAFTNVIVHPLPKALPDETRTCADQVLTAGGLDSDLTYLWEPLGETTSTINIHQSGTYKVHLTNSFACSVVRTIEVTGSCQTNAFAPDSFTPNGDQINDKFRLFVTNGSPIRLTIYNRWGDMVYSEESTNPQWNGQCKGEDCPLGTYSYSLWYKPLGSDAILEHRGSVLLLR